MIESTPFVFAIAAWLATYAIHSTILLLVAWLIARRLPDRPDITSPLWKVAAVGGIVTASFSTAFGVQPLAGRVEVPRVAALPTATVPTAALPIAEIQGPIAPRRPVPASTDLVDGEHLEGVLHVRPVRRAREGEDQGGATASVTVANTAAPRWRWPHWLAVGWSIGAALGLASLVAARLRLAAVLRSRRPAPPDLVHQLALLCADVPARAAPRLFASDAIAVPFAAGVRSPVIVVPSRAASLSPAAQRTMLAHELAHVLRRDPAWRLALAALERVLFFQPLLRLARLGIEHDAEYLCDAWAAERTAAPVELARCLTEIAGWVQPRRPLALAPSMAEPRSILRRRVLRLVAGGSAPTSRPVPTVPAALAICGLLPFVAPMVAWADASARPSIAAVAAPAPSVPPVPVVMDMDAGRSLAAAMPAIAAGPEPTPRSERQTRRRAARAMPRAIRRAGRQDRPPTADELADALEGSSPESPSVDLIYVDDALVAELDGAAIVIDLHDAVDDAVAAELDASGLHDASDLHDAVDHAVAAELDAIIAEADALADEARANARAHDVAAAKGIEARARALRRRAEARRDASARVRVLGRAAVVPFRAPPAPPAPPAPGLAPMPPAFAAELPTPAIAPVAPTAP